MRYYLSAHWLNGDVLLSNSAFFVFAGLVVWFSKSRSYKMFEVEMTIRCRVIAFLSADTSRDLVTLNFNLLTCHICHACRVTWPTLPPSIKTPPIRSWVMSYNVYRWLPLKMRTRLLRMRRITWRVSRGSKAITFLYARPRFAYSLFNFGGSTMTVIKVICENKTRPCVKRRMSFCACAKLRDLLKVP